VKGLDELHPAPIELHRAAEVGVGDGVQALAVEPAGDLDDGHAVGARTPRYWDRVGDMVGVAVGDQDMGGVDLVRGHGRGRIVRLQERVHEDPGVALGELKARVA
jgi:hypothetical protein